MAPLTTRLTDIGGWRLLRFRSRDTATGSVGMPARRRSTGLILYTDDRFMSAQIAPGGSGTPLAEPTQGTSPTPGRSTSTSRPGSLHHGSGWRPLPDCWPPSATRSASTTTYWPCRRRDRRTGTTTRKPWQRGARRRTPCRKTSGTSSRPQATGRVAWKRRAGLLTGYRYLDPHLRVDGPRPGGQHRHLRRDMRNATGGLLLAVLGIASPGGGMSTWKPCPIRWCTSCRVIDPGRDVTRIGSSPGNPQTRTPDGLQPVANRRRGQLPSRVLALTAGRGVAIGAHPEAWRRCRSSRSRLSTHPICRRCRVFGCHRRPDGSWALPELSGGGLPGRGAASARSSSLWRRLRWISRSDYRRYRPAQGVSSHVMFMARGKDRPVPGGSRRHAGRSTA